MKVKDGMRTTIDVDRSSGVLLETQVAEKLKAAIIRGVYRTGETLPGILCIAAQSGVSSNTVRRALRHLADEGWIEPRRHVGSVVSARGLAALACRRILFFTPWPYFSYYSDQFASALRWKLGCGSGRVSIVVANADRGKRPFGQLESFLNERWDLVLEVGFMLESRRMIEASGWPFVVMTNGLPVVQSASANCVGFVDIYAGLDLPRMVRECVKNNVRSVLQVQLLQPLFDVSSLMHISDIRVETISVPEVVCPGDAMRGGLALMRKWLAGRGRSLPDIVLFTDDCVAQGGLLALDECGVRIPEDVSVVTHSVKGHGPVWRKPLARLEMDPFSHAAAVAKAIRSYLRGRSFPVGLRLGSAWIDGNTFWR